MTKNDSLVWKLKAQNEVNEPSDPTLAIEELRSLVKGINNLMLIIIFYLNITIIWNNYIVLRITYIIIISMFIDYNFVIIII